MAPEDDLSKKIMQPLMFKIFLCYKITLPLKSLWWGGVGWSGVEWSESKFSDHSPTIAGSVWIVGSVRIVGESIKYQAT